MYILDTNILISGAFFPGGMERAVIDFCRKNGTLCFSEETATEFSEVMMRPKFDNYALYDDRIIFVMGIFAESVTILPIIKHHLCRDPKDDKLLDVAHVSEASYLITGDQDLLVLKKFGKTRIVTAVDFMKIHAEK